MPEPRGDRGRGGGGRGGETNKCIPPSWVRTIFRKVTYENILSKTYMFPLWPRFQQVYPCGSEEVPEMRDEAEQGKDHGGIGGEPYLPCLRQGTGWQDLR